MDFLKSAVASAISKGPAWPYTFGDRVDIDQSIWTLHNGTKREDGSKCSIFSFEINANKSRLPLAKNALRKFRTLRHPGIVKVLDTVETETYIYIATERVTPLGWKTKRKTLSEESLKWGLYNVAKTLRFINDEAASVHGCIRASSIFTSESGEWRIGGLDILSSTKDDDAIIYSHGSLVTDIGRYSTPEVAKGGWDSLRRNPAHAVDSYDYGILISETFTGGFSGPDQIGSTKGVPAAMHASYRRLLHAAPKVRLSVAHFLEQGSRSGGFFDTPLIQLTEGIDNIGLKTETEREAFLNELEAVADSDDFPEDFFRVKVLPELLKSVEFGGGGPKVFALVMRIASKLADDEYDAQITPVIIRLFASPDRALRVCLLDNLPSMIDHLNQKIVTDKIFPQMVTGFSDMAPVVREQTVKAVLVIVPKLSDRVINGELLRHLAKTANDEQAGIRTNTTICLGKIARNLGAGSRAKILTAAFSRSLRDPFVHARNAALMALAATADVFTEEDCALRMLPAICPSLVDKEKMIRDQANKTMNIYLDRVKRYSQTLPDTMLAPAEAAVPNMPRMGTPQVGNSWTGWAISSFTNKLGTATGEMQTSNGTKTPPLVRSVSTPPANGSTQTAIPSRISAASLTPPSAPAVPRIPSNLHTAIAAPEVEDFGESWSDVDDDVADAAEAWGELEIRQTPAETSPPSTAAHDDGGEPDFEGWLNAQAQAKTKPSRPLPRGLTRKATPIATRPAATARSSAPVTAKLASTPATKSAVQPTKTTEDEQDWGDAW